LMVPLKAFEGISGPLLASVDSQYRIAGARFRADS
jgi:hypothetical protein